MSDRKKGHVYFLIALVLSTILSTSYAQISDSGELQQDSITIPQDSSVIVSDSVVLDTLKPIISGDTIKHGHTTYIRVGEDSILVESKKGSYYLMKDEVKLAKWDKWQKAFQPKPEKNFSIIVLPTVKSTPETGLLVGATGQLFFRPKKAPQNGLSSIVLSGNYTLKKQYQVYTEYEIFLKENKIWFDGEFRYQNWSENFWGIGNETPEEDMVNLKFQQWYWDYRFIYKIKKFYFGPKIKVSRLWDVSSADSSEILTSDVTGINGYHTFGMGLALVWNKRDNNVFPKTGYYLSISNLNYPKWRSGGDFAFYNLEFDYRHFFNPGGKEQIIAIRAYMNMNFGDPPFRLTSLHGGQFHGRGYYEGRYRANHLWSGQVEWRFPMIWRIRGVIYGSIGDVAEVPGDWGFKTIKWGAGAGIRFIMNPKEKTTIRFDYGHGKSKNDKGVYFGMNEVF